MYLGEADRGLRDELARLVKELEVVYREALGKTFDAELLRSDQRVWLSACTSAARSELWGVVVDLYRDRIVNLRYEMDAPPLSQSDRKLTRLLSMASPAGTNFAIRKLGFGFGLCETLVRWFNHTTPTGNMKCAPRVVRMMPGIKEPDWSELKIQDHEELFVKVLEASSVGVGGYLGYLRTGKKSADWIKPKELEQRLAAARAGKEKLWFVRQDVSPDLEGRVETIVRYRPLREEDYCGEEQGTTWFVTDDLKEIDATLTAAASAGGAILFYYRAHPYFFHLDIGGAHVAKSVGVPVFCEIDNYPGKGAEQAEIKLGSRSVLEYLLSPVQRAFHEAGRER
jgi:hypothetical protein